MSIDSATLRAALLEEDLATLRRLSGQGPLVLDGDLSPLSVASAAGRVEAVRLLLALGHDPRERRGNAFTALHAAAMHGHTDAARVLLDAGADPTAQTDPQRYTPLHSAAFAGHEATLRLLIERGALLARRNYRNETAADTARRTGCLAAAELLEEAALRPTLSPRIAQFQWGRVTMSGGRFVKDARLYPGGFEGWDWQRTGTRHEPGIQLADLEDLFALRPEVVLLSRGVQLVLQVPGATVDAVRARGVAVRVLQSEELVVEYNRRCASERVVALLHSTC
jgi:hypothetical protein